MNQPPNPSGEHPPYPPPDPAYQTPPTPDPFAPVDYPDIPPEHRPGVPPGFGPAPTGGYGPPEFSGYPPAPVYPPPYPPYPTGYPVYGPVPVRVPGTNGKAIASIVCGAASLVLCMCYLPALAAIVLGAIAVAEIRQSGQAGQGLAVGGIVLGAVSTLIGVVLTFTG
jgi:Domain of unknown function (DUF4190)